MLRLSPSSSPLIPILLGTSLFLHALTLGHFFYVQTLTESTFAAITTKLNAYNATLEERGNDITKKLRTALQLTTSRFVRT